MFLFSERMYVCTYVFTHSFICREEGDVKKIEEICITNTHTHTRVVEGDDDSLFAGREEDDVKKIEEDFCKLYYKYTRTHV
jgi:hypothetical protein